MTVEKILDYCIERHNGFSTMEKKDRSFLTDGMQEAFSQVIEFIQREYLEEDDRQPSEQQEWEALEGNPFSDIGAEDIL